MSLRFDSMVCNDTISLGYINANPTLEMACKQPPDSLVLWSIGNHPLDGESLRLCSSLFSQFASSRPLPESWVLSSMGSHFLVCEPVAPVLFVGSGPQAAFAWLLGALEHWQHPSS